MAPVVENPMKIRAFKSEAAFEAWLRANHARETEIWLRIYKKDAGRPTVTNAQALDVALCWGWIDGIRKAFGDESFLQRYSPRRARTPESLRARLSHEQHEDAGRAGEEDRIAGGDARARRNHRPGTRTPMNLA